MKRVTISLVCAATIGIYGCNIEHHYECRDRDCDCCDDGYWGWRTDTDTEMETSSSTEASTGTDSESGLPPGESTQTATSAAPQDTADSSDGGPGADGGA